MVIEVVG